MPNPADYDGFTAGRSWRSRELVWRKGDEILIQRVSSTGRIVQWTGRRGRLRRLPDALSALGAINAAERAGWMVEPPRITGDPQMRFPW